MSDAIWSKDIHYVRLTWVDYGNIIRCRIVPWESYANCVENTRPGIRMPTAVFGMAGGGLARGFSSVGNYLFVADTDSLRVYPPEDGTASVFGWFQYIEPSPGRDIAIPLCPRSILQRVLEYARESAGIEFLVGFETEVTFLSSAAPITPVHNFGWCGALALSPGSPGAKVARETADSLRRAGIALEMYHAEVAPGQYEFITGPLPPLQSADALISTREIIVGTANRHGIRATLSPRVFTNSFGSAAHAHISIKPTQEKKKGLEQQASPTSLNLNPIEASFLASLLDHLPAIEALTQPLPASYLRMQDGICSGGTYVAWGTYNKDAPICLVDPHIPNSRRFEIKCIDGLSNPYLVLAGIIAAGTKGVVDQANLTVKDLSAKPAAAMSPEERTEFGVKDRMSLSLEEARQRFKEDSVLHELLGSEFIDAYLRVNEATAEWVEQSSNPAETSQSIYIKHW